MKTLKNRYNMVELKEKNGEVWIKLYTFGGQSTEWEWFDNDLTILYKTTSKQEWEEELKNDFGENVIFVDYNGARWTISEYVARLFDWAEDYHDDRPEINFGQCVELMYMNDDIEVLYEK